MMLSRRIVMQTFLILSVTLRMSSFGVTLTTPNPEVIENMTDFYTPVKFTTLSRILYVLPELCRKDRCL